MKTIRTKKGTNIQVLPTGYRYKAWVNRRQCYFPLGVDAEKAKHTADQIRDHLKTHPLDAVRLKFHPKYTSGSQKTATIGNVLMAHGELEVALGLHPRTAKEYRQALRRLVTWGLGVSLSRVDAEHTSVLTTAMVTRAKNCYMRKREGDDLKAAKRTFNTCLRMAKSVFSRDARPALEAHVRGWNFKHMRDDFLDARPFTRVKKKWVCPSPERIHEIVWKVENAAGGELYAILALALYGGLRLKEIANIEKFWVRDPSPSGPDDVQINIVDSLNFTAKGRQAYTIMKRVQWERIEIRRTCVGNRIVRYNSTRVISQKAGKFLREVCGLDVQKPLHELRKLFGAYVSSRHGLFAAQKYCRHEDPKTTSDYYSDTVLPETCMALWER